MVFFPWIHRWMAHHEVLYDFFDQQMTLCLDASTQLRRFLEPRYNPVDIVSRIGDLELRGDALFAEIQSRMALSYIVPVLKRHEAALLAQSLETILNHVRETAATLRLLNGAEPDRHTGLLINGLHAAIAKLNLMVKPLRTFQHGPILEASRAMTDLDKGADQAVQSGTALLFRDEELSAKDMLRRSMIFDCLIKAIRCCHRTGELMTFLALRHGDFRYARFAP
jgi:uncharacterized protein Yka (UPF0111/DUF47 family)